MDPYWAFKATNHTKLSEPLLQRSVYLFALFKAQYLLPGDLKGDFHETSPGLGHDGISASSVSITDDRLFGSERLGEKTEVMIKQLLFAGLSANDDGSHRLVAVGNRGDEGDAFIVVLVVPSFRYGIECLRCHPTFTLPNSHHRLREAAWSVFNSLLKCLGSWLFVGSFVVGWLMMVDASSIGLTNFPAPNKVEWSGLLWSTLENGSIIVGGVVGSVRHLRFLRPKSSIARSVGNWVQYVGAFSIGSSVLNLCSAYLCSSILSNIVF